MSWIAIIGTALTLIYSIFQEVFSAAARRREEDKAFKLTQDVFLKMVQDVTEKMLTKARQESADAQKLEDQMEQDKKTGISK